MVYIVNHQYPRPGTIVRYTTRYICKHVYSIHMGVDIWLYTCIYTLVLQNSFGCQNLSHANSTKIKNFERKENFEYFRLKHVPKTLPLSDILHIGLVWSLTHWGRVTRICVSKLTIIVAWSVPSHYLNHIYIRENAFEKVVRKLAAILSRPQCVNDAI